jgi:hypothetical protein
LIGASICAGVGVGVFTDVREGTQAMVKLAECYEPNPQNHALYREIAAIYRDAFVVLKEAGVFERMAALGQDIGPAAGIAGMRDDRAV